MFESQCHTDPPFYNSRFAAGFKATSIKGQYCPCRHTEIQHCSVHLDAILGAADHYTTCQSKFSLGV